MHCALISLQSVIIKFQSSYPWKKNPVIIVYLVKKIWEMLLKAQITCSFMTLPVHSSESAEARELKKLCEGAFCKISFRCMLLS